MKSVKPAVARFTLEALALARHVRNEQRDLTPICSSYTSSAFPKDGKATREHA